MQDFREISYSDKKVFDSYITAFPPLVSELGFTNLFMWRKCYRYLFAEVSGFLCVVATEGSEGPFSFCPIGPESDHAGFAKALESVRLLFREKGWPLIFKRVSLNARDRIMAQTGQTVFQAEPDAANSDYVYHSSDLIHLPGKKYDGKRNHIKKFLKSYHYEYRPLTEELIQSCEVVVNKWCEARKCQEFLGLLNERTAIMEALDHFGKLDYKGGVVLVNGTVEAFSLGEQVSRDMAVIHIEKADIVFDGLYTLINQQFCEHAWQDVEFINREQDMGIPGLQRAKMSYHPAKMIEKYIIREAN